MKIVFLARSLGRGGAERQLMLMAGELARRHDVVVVTFYDGAPVYATRGPAPRLRSLAKRGRWDIAGFLLRFMGVVRDEKPDVVYAFMGPPSLVALTAPLARSGTRVVWGIRSSNMELARYDRLAVAARHAERLLSRFADLIISNSFAGRAQAEREGFAARRMIVIGNGIDTSAFARRASARAEVREALGIAADAPLVGSVARVDPMKGYEVFVEAAARVAASHPGVHFVAAGDGAPGYRATLADQARGLGLDGRLHWLGQVDDVAHIYSALDVATSTSVFGEGFSNSVGEAMACGVPCVVTDVGDAGHVVGDTGIVVPSNDPERLADGWRALLDLSPAERAARGERARQRVAERFSVATMVEATERALVGVVG